MTHIMCIQVTKNVYLENIFSSPISSPRLSLQGRSQKSGQIVHSYKPAQSNVCTDTNLLNQIFALVQTCSTKYLDSYKPAQPNICTCTTLVIQVFVINARNFYDGT